MLYYNFLCLGYIYLSFSMLSCIFLYNMLLMVIGFHQILEDISCLCVFTIQKSMNSFHQFKFIPMRGGCFIALHYIICITLIIYITLHYYTLAMGKLCVMQSKMPRDYTLVTGEYTLWLKGKSSYRNHPDVKYRD